MDYITDLDFLADKAAPLMSIRVPLGRFFGDERPHGDLNLEIPREASLSQLFTAFGVALKCLGYDEKALAAWSCKPEQVLADLLGTEEV